MTSGRVLEDAPGWIDDPELIRGRTRKNGESGRGELARTDDPAWIGAHLARRRRGRIKKPPTDAGYFNAVETDVNLASTAAPRPFTTEMMATATPDAMMAYSIEVAPPSSAMNWPNFTIMAGSVGHSGKVFVK